jgi:hypothetical protein
MYIVDATSSRGMSIDNERWCSEGLESYEFFARSSVPLFHLLSLSNSSFVSPRSASAAVSP